jgi:hypothetical protein
MPRRWLVALSLALTAVLCLGGRAPEAVPRQTVLISFEAGQPLPEPAAVLGRDGRPLYYVGLYPQKDVDDNLLGVELTLTRTPDTEGDNLLEPSGSWHGYMDFMFMGWDYPAGPEASVFGRTRHLRKGRVGLPVDVTVEQVGVRSIPRYDPDGPNQSLAQLTLRVEIGR